MGNKVHIKKGKKKKKNKYISCHSNIKTSIDPTNEEGEHKHFVCEKKYKVVQEKNPSKRIYIFGGTFPLKRKTKNEKKK